LPVDDLLLSPAGNCTCSGSSFFALNRLANVVVGNEIDIDATKRSNKIMLLIFLFFLRTFLEKVMQKLNELLELIN